MTFTGVCLAFVNVCQKKKPEKNEKWGLVFIQESYMYMCEKNSILVYTFLVSCDSRIEPISETAIFIFFSTLVQQYYLFAPVIIKMLSDHFSEMSLAFFR